MKYRCSKCGNVGECDGESFEAFEGVEQLMVHCKCGELIGMYEYATDVDDYLPSSDQCRYSVHLCQKQINKLDAAKAQLEDLIEKMSKLEELALERESE